MKVWIFLMWFVGLPALASSLILANQSPKQVGDMIQSSWQQCDESLWCEDSLHYYRLPFIAQAEIANEQATIELFSEFSAHQLGQIQLHLRSDGFTLTKAQIGSQEFDVTGALSKDKVTEVDRQLIQFLNQFPQSEKRLLSWQSGTWVAQLDSDGEVIRLAFYPR